ncbi:MAG: hypothetical protein DRI24_01735 [Deltaproteobacteria bacterium]|nr:MAG: hypothetical protein DRI24_01735 [Deltaproteobacteria bacterium]
MEVLFNNFASGVLLLDILAGDTEISLDVGEGVFFPDPIEGVEYCVLVIEDISGIKEVVHMTKRTGDVLTCTRAQEGTIAQGYSAGSRIELRATAGFFTDFVDAGTY